VRFSSEVLSGAGFSAEQDFLQDCSRVILELRRSSSPECLFPGGEVRLLAPAEFGVKRGLLRKEKNHTRAICSAENQFFSQ
jgi:hypothetical protein